jgi:hypothetical protein
MGQSFTAEEVKQQRVDAMGPKLGRLYSLLVNECNLLHLEWTEYVELFGTRPERIDLLNQSAGRFFRMLQDRLWENALLHIARLTDASASYGKRGKENVSILALPPLVDSAIRPSLEALISAAEAGGKFARDWRNRRIAHRDLELALGGGATPLEPASRASVKKALASIADVLNALELHYLGMEIAYDFIHSNVGAKALLYVLRDGIEARNAHELRLRSGKLLPEDLAAKRPI